MDGAWLTNESHPKEDDGKGNYNNVLHPEDIKDSVHTLSSAAPGSTTAALAGAVPKEKDGKSSGLPGAFPETPAAATPGSEPQTFAVNPIPATEGLGNPIKLAPGEKVPEPSTLTSNTVGSTVKHDKEPAKDLEEKVSVAPIPATAGAGNPIHLAPGEKVPHPSTLTSNTISSTARTDPTSYEKSDAAPPQLGPVVTPEAEREAKGGMFALPPIAGNLIPESSLPKDANAETEKDPGVTIQSAAPTSTTAALAGEVPLEPKGVPLAVTESQKEAGFPPEATANATAVEEKKELEEELKEKVPEEPPAAESGVTSNVISTASNAATVATAAAATAGATAAAGGTYLAYNLKEKAAEVTGTNGAPTTTTTVPEVVTESQKEAHASPEAAANKEAVEEKKEVEAELLKEVKKTNESGAPAPTVTAATTATAPALSDDALTDSKPLKSSSEPDALNAAASKPAIPETSKPATAAEPVDAVKTGPAEREGGREVAKTEDEAIDSRDVSPMSKQPTVDHPAKADAEHEKVKATTKNPFDPSKKDGEPATPAAKATPSSAKGTPESVSSNTTDKKKKRTSIFGKLKQKFKDL